ncbi:MAG TPA: (Fe-S)-binding protein [Gemmatales bacterium]|nr:(Fe-S)-binding protein [Gemmatales bacterium]
MISTRTPLPQARPGSQIDYELFLDCVHCGLCTSACPTYVELGTEMDSPRGRIYLMRGVVDGKLPLDDQVRRHIDLCLDCRACETACPSGVQYGKLLEPFRHDLEAQRPKPAWPWWMRLLLFRVMTSARRARWAVAPARLMERLGLLAWLRRPGLLRRMPPTLRTLATLLPPLPPRGPELPESLPAVGKLRARVALFTGCVNDALFHHVNWATARVLQQNGCEVWTPRQQVCCGAIHYHAGQARPAVDLANQNATVFGQAPFPLDAVVVNVAGCGSLLKDYAHVLPDAGGAGARFAAKVRDVHEFLAELGPVPPTHPLSMRAVYHDACHLCHAQRIRQQPRDLLRLIPGLELVSTAEAELCCGAAGSYNLVQPEMADRLGQRKAEQISAAAPDAVLTANAGCLLQVRRHLEALGQRPWIAHPMEALWASYSGTTPPLGTGVKSFEAR